MTDLAVKIKIGDRTYPMRVQAVDEARVRQAGKLINEQIKAYSEQFRIHDKQDLLAMVAFDCLVAKLKLETTTAHDAQSLEEHAHALVQLLTQTLNIEP